jgi:hypothetical protein
MLVTFSSTFTLRRVATGEASLDVAEAKGVARYVAVEQLSVVQ